MRSLSPKNKLDEVNNSRQSNKKVVFSTHNSKSTLENDRSPIGGSIMNADLPAYQNEL